MNADEEFGALTALMIRGTALEKLRGFALFSARSAASSPARRGSPPPT
jgi:hypothetical protein